MSTAAQGRRVADSGGAGTASPAAPVAGIDVSIIMPCLDEVKTLPICIRAAQDALELAQSELGLRGEVVIADNGSTDGSQQLAGELGARVVAVHEKGYGCALRGGIAAAAGRYIVMGDADGSYDFREAVPMVRMLKDGYELCMGSRFKGEIKPGAMPWKNRYIGNPALTGVLNLFFRSGLSDAHSGLRAFTKSAYRRINPSSEGMEFASEIVIKASLLGLKRSEVPITLHPDGRDRPPHLRPWRDGWRHLRYLVMLSPLWLYFLPAALLGLVGVMILGLLMSAPSNETVTLGRFWIGDHWAVLAGGFVAISHQCVLLGLAATLFGLREGYRPASRGLYRIYRVSRLDVLLACGAVALLAGIGELAYVVAKWSGGGFGALHMIREMVAATTLIVIGLQSIFGGFLLSVIGGNEAEVVKAVERFVRRRPRKTTRV